MKIFIRDLLLFSVIIALNTADLSVGVLQPASAEEPAPHRSAAFEKWINGPRFKTVGEYRNRLKKLGLDSKDAIPLFASKIGNDNVRVRKAAVHGLALIGDQDVPTALPALLQAAKDTDKDVRRVIM